MEESKDLVAEALGQFVEGKVGGPEGMIAAMIQSNYNAYASTTQQLMKSYQDQAAEAQATLDLIRADISCVFDGPYMPTPETVTSCLYPTGSRIKTLVEEREHNFRVEAQSIYGKRYM
jgi:hypothetical protein